MRVRAVICSEETSVYHWSFDEIFIGTVIERAIFTSIANFFRQLTLKCVRCWTWNNSVPGEQLFAASSGIGVLADATPGVSLRLVKTFDDQLQSDKLLAVII